MARVGVSIRFRARGMRHCSGLRVRTCYQHIAEADNLWRAAQRRRSANPAWQRYRRAGAGEPRRTESTRLTCLVPNLRWQRTLVMVPLLTSDMRSLLEAV